MKILSKKPVNIFNYLVFRILILSLLPVYVSYAQKAGNTSGTSSSLLLRFEPSTRVAGLGGAFSGLVDDENAIFYNPAGLAYLDQGMIALNHSEWFEDIRIENLMAGYNLSRALGVGLGITHMWMPDIQGRNASGQMTQPFSVSSSIFTAAFALRIASGLNSGVAVKYFMDNLGDYSAAGVGFDVGLHLQTFIDGLYTGLVVQNLGAQVSYNKENQKIPLTVRLGLVYKVYSPDFNILLDAVKSVDSDPYLHCGVEYTYANQFSVRLGNQFGLKALFTPAAGLGYSFNSQYYLNYTFVLYSDLGGVHRLGFGFHFNNPSAKMTGGQSQYSNLSIYQGILHPPDKINVQITSDTLLLTWQPVAGGEYNVYSRYSAQSNWQKLNDRPLHTVKMEFKKPIVTGIYHFRVSTIINKQESSLSREVELDVN